MRVDLGNDGKYIYTDGGYILRYGEPWLDLATTPGGKAFIAAAYRIEELEEELARIKGETE